MDTQLLLPVLAIFLSIGAATAAGAWLITDPQIVRRRLSGLAPAGVSSATPESVMGEGISPLARTLRSWVPKSPKEMGRIERMMASAGYYGTWPALLFALAQIGITAAAFLLALSWAPRSLSMPFAMLAAGIGYYLPTMWLGRAVEARRREIRNGLPDAIDLMIVCVESGSGIDQALSRVAEELALPYPALARELDMISAETRAGRTRLEAFRNFAERTKVDDVRSLVAMLV